MKTMLIAATITGALVAGLLISFSRKKSSRMLGFGPEGSGSKPERSMKFTMG